MLAPFNAPEYKKYMFVDRESRAQSLAYLRGTESMPTLLLPGEMPEPDSPEALEYLDSIKTLHYARLAQVIDVAVCRSLDKRADRPPDGLLTLEWVDDPFWLLDLDFLQTLGTDIYAIRETAEFQEAEKITRLIGALDTHRFNDLAEQLRTGSGTAVTLMMITLRNLPNIIRAHAPAAEADYREVAEASFGLIRQPAMLSINQLMGSRSALMNRIDAGWSVVSSALDPANFKVLVDNGRVRAVRYKNLGDLVVPAGDQLDPYEDPIEEDTPLRNIKPHQKTTIGCPITLLEGRLRELWQWAIEAVELRDIWELEPPENRKRPLRGIISL